MEGKTKMNHYYDITNPDASYDWLYEVLHFEQGELITEYCLNCQNDFEVFFEKFLPVINEIDVENLEFVAFQVTSNNDDCKKIKQCGVRNLQWTLSNDTELNSFLQQKGIRFDISKKLMIIDDVEYDIDYEKYRNLRFMDKKEDWLHKIGHKVYYDFQINAFLLCKDIYSYGTIHEAPEFLFTLSSFSGKTADIDSQWKIKNSPYVIKFKAKLSDFAYFTFYDTEDEYYIDQQNGWYGLRKNLISKAVDSAFSANESEIFAYMKPDTVIKPENILACIPADKWSEDILKYF